MNHKTILAVAISALVAMPAFADSPSSGPNITLYGLADVGARIGNYGDGVRTQVSSGQGWGDRFGVKGEQAFDDGSMKAILQIEAGIHIDTGTSAQGGDTWGRQAYAGLTGDYGTATFGRQYSPGFNVLDTTDAFDTGFGPSTENTLFANSSAMPSSINGRIDNLFLYSTPSISGFKATVGYTSSATGGTGPEASPTGSVSPLNHVGRGYLGSAEYSQGPLYLGIGYQDIDLNPVGISANSSAAKWLIAGGTYNFDVAKVFVSYAEGKVTQAGTTVLGTNGDGWGLGVSVPMGRHTVIAQYSHYTDKDISSNNCGLAGVGDQYQSAKNVVLYAVYSHVNNSKTGQCSPNGASSNDITPIAGYNDWNLMLGVAYRF